MQGVNFQRQRNLFPLGTNHVGKCRGGKMEPLYAIPFEQSEGGHVDCTVNLSLDPIAGNMITQIGAELIAVYVPNLAIHGAQFAGEDMADSADFYRAKLADGIVISDMEEENEVTKRMNIKPVSVNGQKMVRKTARQAYVVAWNYLARRIYRDAWQASIGRFSPLPALWSTTALQMFNAVLDPDDRIQGEVQLELQDARLPVSGIGFESGATFTGMFQGMKTTEGWQAFHDGNYVDNPGERMVVDGENGMPKIEAVLTGQANSLSLQDLWRAEESDKLVRAMDAVMRENPEYGEELALRMAYGLNMDVGAQPQIVYRAEQSFGQPVVQRPMDGPSMDGEVRSHMGTQMRFSTVIPASEFGGVLVIMVAVKPDETIGQQPHPVFSEPLKRIEFMPEELTLDPQPVRVRELNSDCDQAEENELVFYTGLNQMRANYQTHGLNREVDPTTVANKNALWQIELPLSLSPETVMYPDEVDHYPFALNGPTDEPVNYHVVVNAAIATPRQLGPTPIEKIDIFGDEDFQPIEEQA